MFREKIFLVLIISATIILLANISCTKEAEYMNDAVITGYDGRMCICCGGLMINFTGETKPYIGDFKLIRNSSDLGLTTMDTFPIRMMVDWKADTTGACNRITITKFARE